MWFYCTSDATLEGEGINNLDATEATSYVNHVKQCEETFKKSDIYVEEIEEELNDDYDEDNYSAYSIDTDDEWSVCWFYVNNLILFWINEFGLRTFFRRKQKMLINKST